MLYESYLYVMPLLYVVLCSVQICRDHCEVQVSGHTGGHCRRSCHQDKTAVRFGCNFFLPFIPPSSIVEGGRVIRIFRGLAYTWPGYQRKDKECTCTRGEPLLLVRV